jgi:transposase-like protein
MGPAFWPALCQYGEAAPITTARLAVIDEVFIRIRGKQHYRWRAVDQDGNVLDILRHCGQAVLP